MGEKESEEVDSLFARIISGEYVDLGGKPISIAMPVMSRLIREFQMFYINEVRRRDKEEDIKEIEKEKDELNDIAATAKQSADLREDHITSLSLRRDRLYGEINDLDDEIEELIGVTRDFLKIKEGAERLRKIAQKIEAQLRREGESR